VSALLAQSTPALIGGLRSHPSVNKSQIIDEIRFGEV
jgi:hypothetical protein